MKRRIALTIVAAFVVLLAGGLWRPLKQAAVRAKQKASESAGVARVEGHAALLRRVANETSLDANLLAGLVFVESRGKIGAVSGVDALGLFQLRLETAVERAALLGLDEPTRADLLEKPELNARLGAHHLAWLIARYKGDVERALIAYNAGPGKLERWIKDAGSYASWRDAAEVTGRSDVLAYARTVLAWRERFAESGTISAPIGPPGPEPEIPAGDYIGPPLPEHVPDAEFVRPSD